MVEVDLQIRRDELDWKETSEVAQLEGLKEQDFAEMNEFILGRGVPVVA